MYRLDEFNLQGGQPVSGLPSGESIPQLEVLYNLLVGAVVPAVLGVTQELAAEL